MSSAQCCGHTRARIRAKFVAQNWLHPVRIMSEKKEVNGYVAAAIFVVFAIAGFLAQQNYGRISAEEALDSIELGTRIEELPQGRLKRYSSKVWVYEWIFFEEGEPTTLPEDYDSDGRLWDSEMKRPDKNQFGTYRERQLGLYNEVRESLPNTFSGIVIFSKLPLFGDEETVELAYIDGVLRDKKIAHYVG